MTPDETDERGETDDEDQPVETGLVADVDWLEAIDEEILEVLNEPHNFSPSHAAEAEICRGPEAAYRCRELAEHGLLKQLTTGMYEVTDLGERFLEDNVDASELVDSDES